MTYSLKQKLGAVVYDLPRFIWTMRPSEDHAWLYMRNRDEHLSSVNGLQSPVGVRSDWQWTSDLHIAKVFPSLGRALMKRALRNWPIEFRSAPLHRSEEPEVSFILGHRGVERLPHLLLTLQTIAAQRETAVECVIVEQSATPEVRHQLPSWVRYIQTPLPYPDMAYSRSWAFNVGARVARGEILVLHDNDMLVPVDYAKEIRGRVRGGHEVMDLKRFIFYLTESHSSQMLSSLDSITSEPPQTIMQNAFGGSIAVVREAYFEIGGFDESFIGWGGEDNEFWDRAQTRRVWPYGYLPMVHLWHPMQTGKYQQERETAKLLELRSAIPPQDRIAELAKRDFGNPRSQTSEVRSQKSEVGGQNRWSDL